MGIGAQFYAFLMLENLSLSYVLNSPLGHKIQRRSMWKKTILKTKKTRVLPFTVRICKGACVRSLNLAYIDLTMRMHAAGLKNPNRTSLA